MPDVVIVIIPLPAVFATWRILRRIQQACAVVAVFEHEMDVTAALGGKLADCDAKIVQDRDFAGFNDGIDGIEPQSVKTIFLQPIQGILDGEGAYLSHAVIDRATPR